MATDKVVDMPRESVGARLRGYGPGYLVKLVLMALVNAFGLSTILAAFRVEAWGILAASVVLLIVIDWIYFSKRALPLKYLAPGLVFLAIFQIFTMAYTGYIAFTNYGTAHNVTKGQAIETLLTQHERRVEGTSSYRMTIARNGDEVGIAIVRDGEAFFGTADEPLAPVDGAVQDGLVTEVPGWEVVPRAQLFSDLDLAAQVQAIRVAISDDPNDGSVRASTLSEAVIYRSTLHYDEQTDSMRNSDTGVVYRATEEGYFQAEDGTKLATGWRVHVGFENFARAVTDVDFAKPLLYITAWTFVFATLTVLTSFLFGLVLAIIFNDPRIKGRRVWRTLFILPYAFPAFLSALLWRGMLNPQYGVINDWFFNDSYIQWLSDPWLAKFSILFVNLWLSYPYWFLVCTGALQALPTETLEAAKIDGAGKWRTFRSVQIPLLLVSTAPLLIASFAFNFNNFTVIYMLTDGQPRFHDASVPLGQTDILITAIYRISGVAAGSSSTADYGFASALSIVVFIVIGAISLLAFRQTKKLEEVA